jgi:cyclase
VSHRQIDEIADGVWLGRPAYREGAMGAVLGDDLTLIIDSTSYPPFAARFVEEVAGSRPQPKLLYITHRHFDHFGGAAAIDAPIMSHRLTRAALASYDDAWLDRHIPAWIEQGLMDPELVGEPEVVIPHITFEGDTVVDVGGREVLLRHVGGHTADQSIAYVPSLKLLWGSDNVFSDRDEPVVAHADVPTWIDALERLSELEIEIVVPGHGDIGGPELLVNQLEQLRRTNLEQMGASA